MFKLLTIALASTVIGAGSAATASACGGCSSSCAMPMSHSAMKSAPSHGMEGREMPTAPSAARSTRRYSYEPSARSYSAPRMRSFRSSPNSLPKSDPRRYNF